VAHAKSDRFSLTVDEPGEGDTDVAVAEQADMHDIVAAFLARLRLIHVHKVQDGDAQASQASRSVTVSRRTTILYRPPETNTTGGRNTRL